MYKLIFRPLLFLFDPEKAHKIALFSLKLVLRIPLLNLVYKHSGMRKNGGIDCMGLTFKNRIGLAAGFDKDGKYIQDLSQLGFGFIEIGTITPKPQDGNPKPRLLRLKKDQALLNRMGFNNEGVEAMVTRLKGSSYNAIIGGNIGKNKTTPNKGSDADYLFCFDRLYDLVDYFVVNVSSPNTPDLRALQDKEPLTKLLSTLQSSARSKSVMKPILVKIAPDLTRDQIRDIIDIVKFTDIAGVVATNTTIVRENLLSKTSNLGAGGISGLPVREKSNDVIRQLRAGLPKEKVIIGVGGIFTLEDAEAKIKAGADLVQVYTGFIYEGPSMVRQMVDL
ncbi:MAG: quinone-dependent dihydroorotate dehydrogenase [Saprospiraceae bacterium]